MESQRVNLEWGRLIVGTPSEGRKSEHARTFHLDSDDNEERRSSEPSSSAPDTMADRLNALLDRSFFDPSQDSKSDPKLVSDFKSLFQSDPEMASIIFVGLYFALLLFFAQQGIRVYQHCYFMPDKLCPWDVSPSFDELLNF